MGMYLNLYEVKLPYRIKRLYYYNPENEPEVFAKNLSRVNNIRFTDSNDLIWLEIPDIDFKIIPEQAEQYRIDKMEIIDENSDEKLFVKTLYKYIKKKFMDNGFYFKKGNNFVSIKDIFPLETNEEVIAHTTYKIKIHKFNEKYYISILPKFTFLSELPALESRIKSTYLFNIKSGKSFPYISGLNDVLKIDLGEKGIKDVKFPENYYFNFTSSEAEKYGFSKEIHKIYKEKIYGLYKKIPSLLNFLDEIVEIRSYNLTAENRIYENIEYKFKNGTSRNAKDVFKYSFYKNGQTLHVGFFLSSKKQFYEVRNALNNLFRNKNSIFYRTAAELGFSKVEFIRDPESNNSVFRYDPETYHISNRNFIESLNNHTMAIIILDKYIGNISPLVKKFPSNLELQPILKEKFQSLQSYIIKSYVYKMGNFMPGCKPFILKNLEKNDNTLYIGMDMSHDTYLRKTNFAISAVNHIGDIIYISSHENLELNEKMNIDILEEEYIKAISKYKEKTGNFPENVFIIRDGKFLEEINQLDNIFGYENIEYTLIEINKNTNINSYDELKEWIIKMDENTFIYYPKTFLNQRGVEIKIIFNNTNYTNLEIVKQIYALTRVAHSTPYTNYKLPYPLHIVNKVALDKYEWKLYIPYKN